MIVFLLLLLVAVVLGFIGVLAEGLIYLLIIGIVVAIAAFLYLGRRMGRRSGPAPR
ncbi:hypothetical protein ACFWR9_02260 [Streptomyces sp. NPDC058534]|uniref:hypothetical protein n=1 Tax=Streptomyces sp. NPDC058534 TaxID=3346541 RepID=UPI0036535180